MPTEISHYPDASTVLLEFLDAKIPLTNDDLKRRLNSMTPLTLADLVDVLRRAGLVRKLEGDDDPYVVTLLAMETADLFGETGWHEGEASEGAERS
jgi:hypothetical protein